MLNACDGARTTLTDPFAGVATTLVQLGVPAVVAMQFAISDAAAILFAEELYTNLIGRRAPIDAAVSEARKAIYIEQGTVEWATPVLFMADTDVELLHWTPAAAAPAAVALPTGRHPAADPAAPVAGRARRRRSLVGGGRCRRCLPPPSWSWSSCDRDDAPDADASDDGRGHRRRRRPRRRAPRRPCRRRAVLR